jgi:hypothetical protein
MEQFRRTAKLNGGNGCFAPKSAGGETIQASEDHVRFSGMMASLSALLGRMHPNVRHNRATHLHCGWFDPQIRSRRIATRIGSTKYLLGCSVADRRPQN